MKRLVFALAVILLSLPWGTTFSAPHGDPGVRADEIIIKVKPGVALSDAARVTGADAETLDTALREAGATWAYSLGPGSSTYRIQLRTNADIEDVARQLASNSGVVHAEPNHIRTLMRSPNDSVIDQQWALRNIRAFEAWDVTTGGDITIAVLDTGVSPTHPDLRNKLLPGYDFFNNDADPSDDEGHGTHIAGVAAAESDNGVGVAGVCWGCKILPVKVLGRRGQGDDATIAAGIRWATDQGARIISMSLGGPEDTQALRDAVAYARERNVLIVAASGNGQLDGNAPNYPAAYPEVLAVSATGASDTVTGFSTTGDFVDIAAPGVGVWSTLWARGADTYGVANGTSAAAPHVAGAAALILSLRPDLRADQVADLLQASADDEGASGRDTETGSGRLNVLRAVQLAADPNVLSQSRIEGFATGAPPDQIVISLNTGQQTQPDANGFFSFGGLPTGAYTVSVRWPDGQTATQETWLSGTALSVAAVNFSQRSGIAQFFLPVPPPSDPSITYFPETQHTLRGTIRNYWRANGGLPIFGYPISEEFVERGEDGREYVVQYFERHRLEVHPENAPPYNVLLTRLGDTILQLNGRSWFEFLPGTPQPDCLFFEETSHSLCGIFLDYWQSNGLELNGLRGKTRDESLALFGQPISEPQIETLSDGKQYIVQWFERARFEYHEGQGVLLGLLGNELAASRR
jgi:subtilisin family serine protease